MTAHVNRDVYTIWIGKPKRCNGIVFLRRGRGTIGGIEKVLRQFGFKTKTDYIHAYPGKFRKDSKQSIIQICSTDNIFKETHTAFKRVIRLTFGLEYCGELCTAPTMKEILRCNLYEDAEKNELWFCSDWSEEDQ